MNVSKRRLHGLTRSRLGLEPLEVRNLLSNAGSLDPSFGSNLGFVTLPAGPTTGQFSSDNAQVAGVVVQADGKIVIGGEITSGETTSFAVERLNADGTPDTSFGQGGLSLFAIPGPAAAQRTGEATGVFLQSDGKIIVAGDANQFSGSLTGHAFIAVRFDANGAIDTAYGNNGLATVPTDPTEVNNGQLTVAKAGALQPDGKLILVGSAPSGSSQADFAAVRLDTNGTLDATFGTAGTALVPVTVNGITTGIATGVALQSNGQIVLAGNVLTGSRVIAPPATVVNDHEAVAIRLNADGTPDTTYGNATDGQVILPPNPASPSTLGDNQVFGVTIQPDGKVLLEGTDAATTGATAVPTLTRFNADGTIDTSFGQGGRVTTAIDGPTVVQANGMIVEAGSITVLQADARGTFERSQFATLRLNADGTPDASYGNTTTPGLAQYSFGASNLTPEATALAIQPDGNIVVAGSTSAYLGNFTTIDRFAVARVLDLPATTVVTRPEATPSASFDGSGFTDLAVYLTALGEFAYRPVGINGDQLIPFGIAGAGQTISAAADYAGIGQTQIAAYLPSQGLYAIRPTSGPDEVFSFGIAGAGQSIPVPADYLGTGQADVAVYMPSIGAFGIRNPKGGPDQIIPFGTPGIGQSIPAPADYFGTGQADIAVYLPTIGAFAIRPPGGGPDQIVPFGIPGAGDSIPIPGDYDGSGKIELAVYFPKLGAFAYRPADGGPDVIEAFGAAGDGSIPVPGDYTGVGHDEIAVYDPKYGTFAYRPANGGADVIEAFGSPGVGQSVPIAAPASIATGQLSAESVTIANQAATASTKTIVSSLSATVPAGPKARIAAKAHVRVASTLPAQADPSKPKG